MLKGRNLNRTTKTFPYLYKNTSTVHSCRFTKAKAIDAYRKYEISVVGFLLLALLLFPLKGLGCFPPLSVRPNAYSQKRREESRLNKSCLHTEGRMEEMKEERRPRPLLSYASQVDANCTYARESICPVSPLGSHCAVSASVLHIVREVTINHPDGGELINLASFLPLMEKVRKVIPVIRWLH